MSNTITIKNEKPAITTKDEQSWLEVGRVIGYPDSWTRYLEQSLSQEGKNWHWKTVTPQNIENEAVPNLGKTEEILLIVDAKSNEKAISKALLFADRSDSPISVVYISNPPLVSESKKSNQVDEEFVSLLKEGKQRLSDIESSAKKLGVVASTGLVWAGSSKEVLKERKAGVVFDETSA